ncbi:LysR family transcriptional regulator [Aquitalea sp. ASV11]|uniref:LysR family transcriptional regulator n=1 Tax=Aquitalea sp. ASV11 TaxID=2795103 RepID=UPI0018ED5B55|nr:LysR substrate-binding domain-containing protein [Aquitalea sp. ASV11]
MKLATLAALIAAVEEGSMRAAARRIGCSQPALTRMIRELELELAAPLLLRSSRGVLPTAQGRVLYERAVRARHELEAAADEISQIGGHMVGKLHIGAVPLAVMLLIPEAMRTFVREFPQIQLRISEELYVAQLQKLRTGEVDITVGGIPDDLAAGEFYIEPLLHTEMIPTARKGSRWLEAKSLQDLQAAPWVYTGTDHRAGYARALFERNGLEAPQQGALVNSTLALLSLVSTGDYVALLPRQIARQSWLASYVSPIALSEQGLPLQVGAILRQELALAPVVRHLLTHLHRAAHHINRGDTLLY